MKQSRLLIKQPSPPTAESWRLHIPLRSAKWEEGGLTFSVLLVEVRSLTIHQAHFLFPKSISVTSIPGVAGRRCSVSHSLMPYDGCSVCQAQMLLKLFQQSWSAARANVFISSTAPCAQEPPICPSEGNAFWWPSKSLSEASGREAGNSVRAIANNYGRPIGDQDFQVLATAKLIARWIPSLAQLRKRLPPLQFAACRQTLSS